MTALDNMLKHKLLTAERERELLTEYARLRDKLGAGHKRTIRVRNQVVEANLKLAAKYANRRRVLMGFDELLSYGVEGLIEAVERFEVERGLRYSTFAQYWVKAIINRGIANRSTVVRVPVGRQARGDVDSGCTRVGVVLMSRPVSFDAPLSGDNENDLHSVLGDDADGADDSLGNARAADDVRRALYESGLTAKEREIIECRFGLRGNDEETLNEVGVERLGVSRQRIRKLEELALKKMRRSLTKRGVTL